MTKYLGSGAAYGIFEKQVLQTDGVATEFTLLYQVGHASSILVISDGVVQEPNFSYALTEGGRKIAFSYAPPSEERIYVVFLGRELAVPVVPGNYPLRIRLDSSIINGTTTDFNLSTLFPTLFTEIQTLREESLIVFQNGTQRRFGEDWTLNVTPDLKTGNTIKFTTAPPSSSTIDIYIHGVERSDITTVSPATITGDKLANNITIGSVSNKCEAIYAKNIYADVQKDLLETEQVEVTNDGFPNSGLIILTKSLETTSSSDTVIWEFVPPTSNCALWFEVDLIALNTTSDENCWINIKSGAKRNGGVTELIGIQKNVSATDNSDYGAYADVEGTSLKIKVNGHPSDSVKWAATIKYQVITA